MEVTDIGRKSLHCFGFVVFGTGQILACLHCIGTMEVLIVRLIRSVSGLLKTGAPRRTNHAGRPFRPEAVGFRLSSIETCYIQ